MDLPVVTRNQLYDMNDARIRKHDEELVSRIVHHVYNVVLSHARLGKTAIRWSADVYMFEFQIRHIVIACVRLQELFPDSKVSRISPKEILVEWR